MIKSKICLNWEMWQYYRKNYKIREKRHWVIPSVMMFVSCGFASLSEQLDGLSMMFVSCGFASLSEAAGPTFMISVCTVFLKRLTTFSGSTSPVTVNFPSM
ncbi:hypothetical protein Hanom_Chr09g00775331 [Helianthus anomalus]